MPRENWNLPDAKKEIIDAKIANTEKIILALKEIRSGKAITFVCNKYDLDIRHFRSFLDKEALGYKKVVLPVLDSEEPLPSIILDPFLSFGEKLWIDVTKIDDITRIPPDIDDANLSSRAKSCLFRCVCYDGNRRRANLRYIYEHVSVEDLNSMKSVGPKTAHEIIEYFKSIGAPLKPANEVW